MSIIQGGRRKGAMVSLPAGAQGPAGPVATPIYAELYVSSNAVATALTVMGTFYQIVAGWVNGLSSGTTPQAGASNIKCLSAGVYRVVVTATHTNDAISVSTFEFAVFVNGIQVAKVTQRYSGVGPTELDDIALSGLLNLGVNDLVDIRARCTDAAAVNLTVSNINFSLVAA